MGDVKMPPTDMPVSCGICDTTYAWCAHPQKGDGRNAEWRGGMGMGINGGDFRRGPQCGCRTCRAPGALVGALAGGGLAIATPTRFNGVAATGVTG